MCSPSLKQASKAWHGLSCNPNTACGQIDVFASLVKTSVASIDSYMTIRFQRNTLNIIDLAIFIKMP